MFFRATHLLTFLFFLSLSPWLIAQEAAGEKVHEFRIGTKIAPPFVMQDQESGDLYGFSIDLMEKLVNLIDPTMVIDYQIHSDIQDHLEAVKQDKVDLGIAATTITVEREKEIDFSYPFYHTGLGIAVSKEKGRSRWDFIFTQDTLFIILALVAYLFICANLIWLVEKGEAGFSDDWFHGIFEGVWWTIVTMSTVGYGDFVPRRAFSRFLAVFIIFTGIVLFGLAVANFSSILTLQGLQSEIQTPEDLFEHRVAVVENTIGAQILNKMYIQTATASTLKEALELLDQHKVDAVVHDLPILQYYTKWDREKRFFLTGGLFEPSDYGITFPLGSPLRKKFNIALLQIKKGEPSAYEILEKKWFGLKSKRFTH